MATATFDEHPLVSVIMPAYNAEDTIAESIQSVIDQTYSNWELIVVDDGSTDKTGNVAQTFKDDRIRLINKKNSGVAETRNQAIRHSAGEFIAFLDSDDIWMPAKLEIQLAYFKKCDNTLGLVHSNYFEFNESREFKPKPFKHTKKDFLAGDVANQLMVHDFVATLTVIVKKEVFDTVGYFDTGLNGPEDWDLWIRIAKKFRCGFIDLPLAKYRLNPKGLSKSVATFEKELWKVINRHLLSSDLSMDKKNKGLWLYFRHMAHSYAKNNEFKKAFCFLQKTIKVRPTNLYNFASILYLIRLRALYSLKHIG